MKVMIALGLLAVLLSVHTATVFGQPTAPVMIAPSTPVMPSTPSAPADSPSNDPSMVPSSTSPSMMPVAPESMAPMSAAPSSMPVAPQANGMDSTAPSVLPVAPLSESPSEVPVAPAPAMSAVPSMVSTTAGITFSPVPVSAPQAPVASPALDPAADPVVAPVTGLPVAPSPVAPSAPVAIPPIGDNYFDDPILQWGTTLTATGGLVEKGNGVFLSPDNGFLYITRNDGRLDVIQASNGADYFNYTPPPNENGWAVTCTGGVAFGDLPGVGPFAVYTVIEQAPLGDENNSISRVVAIPNPPVDGEILWTSDPIEGEAQGTPVVTQKDADQGLYVYLTSNINVGSMSALLPETGVFSVISTVQLGAVIFSESNAATGPAPYGPLGVAHNPTSGKYEGGALLTSDLVVWTTSLEEGFGRSGNLTAFQMDISNPQVFFLRNVRWNAIAKPTLSSDGQELFVSMTSGQLRAWVGTNSFNSAASWGPDSMLQVPARPATPLPNAPVLSVNETQLFVSSATNSFARFSTDDGTIDWEMTTGTTFSSEAKVSPEDLLVYSIQVDGVVQARFQETGGVAWTTDCTMLGYDCTGSTTGVQGEFSLSNNGLILYYADSNGNVLAVQLGTSGTPTTPPSDFPGSAVPSTLPTDGLAEVPSLRPSTAPSADAPQTAPPTAPPTTPPPTSSASVRGLVTSVMLSLFVALLA